MGADFSGYATKAGLKCSDGRTIMPDAFKHMDGKKVPLVWQHGHGGVENVIGHALLTARPDGVYAECFTNSTPNGKHTKSLVQHGDIDSLSIYANKLVEKSKQVFHGTIREVSLVLSGANPGAKIDFVALEHSDGSVENLDDEAVITTGEPLEHAEGDDDSDSNSDEGDDETTVGDIYNRMTEEQKTAVDYLVSEALAQNAPADDEDSDDSDDDAEHGDNDDEGDLNHQEGSEMPRNVFEGNGNNPESRGGQATLTHDQMSTIIEEGKKNGSFKDAVLAHAEEYGITNIEVLFPDAKAIDDKPEWITRRIDWVESVLNATRKLPFAKIKSLSADLTHEEARAKGYIKNTMKKEQFFEIAKRETGPKTIYKKQRLDRDDIIDITDFDVVAWLWVEMRFMLREEIARAILVGDGREIDDPDKIDENKIRPIAKDNEFYTDVVTVGAGASPNDVVEAVLRGRRRYKGSGQPHAYIVEDVLTDMLLQRDKMGRRLYRNESELAAELRVSGLTAVPILEDVTTDQGELLMILVNLSDYSVGSTRGGEITTFDDFDIDWNQYKYLIEGRMSGALTKHKSAQVVVRSVEGSTEVTPQAPTFDPSVGVLTVPSQTGVSYTQDGEPVTAGDQPAIEPGTTTYVSAAPDTGYHFPSGADADWEFTSDA